MSKPAPQIVQPPRLASWIIAISAIPDFKLEILGDLHEEWLRRRQLSVASATLWYWQQALKSLPTLLSYRFSRSPYCQFALICFSCLVTYAVITLWDHWVARSAVGVLASQPEPPAQIWLRVFYFAVFMIGLLISGIIGAAIGFQSRQTFFTNVLIAIGPAFVILNSLLLISVISAGNYALLPYIVFRAAVIAITLILGALIYQRLLVRVH